MKICFLADSVFTVGGVQRVCAVIAKALAQKGHDITIMTFDEPEKKDTTLYGLNEVDIKYQFVAYPNPSAIKEKCCKAYSYIYRRLLPKEGIFNDLYAHSSFPSERRLYLAGKLAEGHYDVIVGVHVFLAARLATMQGQLHKAKLIGWSHNSYDALFGEDTKYYLGPVVAPYYASRFKMLDHFVVLTHQDAQVYQKLHGITPTAIYNPLTLKPGKPSTGDSKKFLAVGRLAKGHKGFDILIDAFNIFAKQNKEWTLDIVGEGPEQPVFEKMIQDYQLQDRVKIHPFTNNIQEYYSAAQVYILSSRWEGFGLVIVEAMAHALPVISSDLPTSKEIMGDTGHYFTNGNAEELAQEMLKATNYNWSEEADKALKTAQRFTIGTIIAEWEKIIND